MVNAIHKDNWIWPNPQDDCSVIAQKCALSTIQYFQAKMHGNYMAIDLTKPFVPTMTTGTNLVVAVDVYAHGLYSWSGPQQDN
jgi:hypothetical protein